MDDATSTVRDYDWLDQDDPDDTLRILWIESEEIGCGKPRMGD
jgi:hypothetical protein